MTINKYLTIYKIGDEKWALSTSIKKHKLFSPNKIKWNISLLTSARVPSTQICEFCYGDTSLSIFQWVYQKDRKGRLLQEKKKLNIALKKFKFFIEHIHPSHLCRKMLRLFPPLTDMCNCTQYSTQGFQYSTRASCS